MSDKINTKDTVIMAFVPTRDLVVFPNMTVYFDVARSFSVSSIKKAMENDTALFFLLHKKTLISKIPRRRTAMR